MSIATQDGTRFGIGQVHYVLPAMVGEPLEKIGLKDTWLKNPSLRKITISYDGQPYVWEGEEEHGPHTAWFAEWLQGKSVDKNGVFAPLEKVYKTKEELLLMDSERIKSDYAALLAAEGSADAEAAPSDEVSLSSPSTDVEPPSAVEPPKLSVVPNDARLQVYLEDYEAMENKKAPQAHVLRNKINKLAVEELIAKPE